MALRSSLSDRYGWHCGCFDALWGRRSCRTTPVLLFWLSERGEAIWVNQGLNGLLHRFLGNRAAIETVGQSQSVYPPYHLGVHVLSTLFMGLIIGLALFFPRRGQGQAAGPGTLDFATMIVAVTFSNSIAWMHQYGGVLPVFALAMAMLLSIPERLVLAGPLLAIAYISMGQVVLKWSWFFENPWRGLLGLQVFFGALAVVWSTPLSPFRLTQEPSRLALQFNGHCQKWPAIPSQGLGAQELRWGDVPVGQAHRIHSLRR